MKSSDSALVENIDGKLIKREPLYFNIAGKWYKGKMPTFYDNSHMPIKQILEDNYEKIKEEIIDFYSNSPDRFQPQYVPYKYQNKKWTVFSFYGFLLKFEDNLRLFPKLNEVLNKIPGLLTSQILVLEPHTRVKAHFAGSNAIIRHHLGIVVPGRLPDIGFRIKSEERCWEEGKLLSFCESHRHYVWNNTDHPRIILLIDTIHPDYQDKKAYAASGVLSMLTLKMFAHKFPALKSIPNWLTIGSHKFFIYMFMAIIFVQDKIGINVLSLLQRLKFSPEKA